ncbi:MAG: diacylglycerol kinase family lipid kinase [Lachnospira sp.]|nr:diacylglycerol kinase family lipid kinase [Lachnospira sp.]
MKKMLFVFNPNSGKARIKNKLVEIVQIFSNAGYDVTVYPTKARMDGYKYMIENMHNYDIVTCSGGDGTLNETVSAVLSCSDKKMPIGYIPSGSTNDFANSLSIPKDMELAAEYIVEGSLFSCDIGMVNKEKYFCYVAAFGAFTEVSYLTPQYLKNMLGHQAYILEAAKSLAALKPYYIRVTADGHKVEGEYVYGMISNTESVGGVKGLAGSSVDLQDGLFEVTLVKKISGPMEFQQLVTAFLTQNYDESGSIFSIKAKHIEVECGEGVNWTLDGEFGGEHRNITFDVVPGAVEFMMKQKTK